MVKKALELFWGWMSSRSVSWFAPYWEAKKLHEGSPHGLFPRTFFHALTPEEIAAASSCPRLERALQLYRECIVREGDAERYLNQGIAFHQLGLLLHRQGRLADAFAAYEEALKLLGDLPNVEALPAISTCHFRVAEILLARGDRKAAREALARSRRIDESLNDRGGLALNDELRRRIQPDSAAESPPG